MLGERTLRMVHCFRQGAFQISFTESPSNDFWPLSPTCKLVVTTDQDVTVVSLQDMYCAPGKICRVYKAASPNPTEEGIASCIGTVYMTLAFKESSFHARKTRKVQLHFFKILLMLKLKVPTSETCRINCSRQACVTFFIQIHGCLSCAGDQWRQVAAARAWCAGTTTTTWVTACSSCTEAAEETQTTS